MTRFFVVVLLVVSLLGGLVAPVAADHVKSTLQVLADNPKARFNPKVQVLLVEQRLSRPGPLQLYPAYLSYQEGNAGVDQQIRRLGELIRRHERE